MERKRFADVCPDIKGVFTTECVPTDIMNSRQKQAYTARILVALSGDATFITNGKAYTIDNGMALYMPPNQPYSTVFHSRFVVQQICFDFFPYRTEEVPFWHIMIDEAFDARFMSDPVRFSDTDVFDVPFVVDGHPALLSDAMTLLKEYEERRIGYPVRTRALLAEILVTMFRARLSVPDADSQIGAMLAYINEHCGEELTRETLASRFHYHPNHINRLVLQATGMTLHHYIIETRIRCATKYLRETNLSITEIAHILSFCDSSYFCAVFQKYTGMTPRAYRIRCIGETETAGIG